MRTWSRSSRRRPPGLRARHDGDARTEVAQENAYQEIVDCGFGGVHVATANRRCSNSARSTKPDVAEVARRTTVLAGVARKLRTAGGGVTDFGKRVKDKAQDKAAEIVATAVVGGGAAFHQQIGSALQSIGAWFRMLF